MTTSNGSVFQVILAGPARAELRDLHQRARSKGRGKELILAVKRITARLRSDPDHFGEARFRLQYLNLEVRVGTVPPVLVVYGINKERRIVFVRDFLLLPGSD